MSLPYNRRLIPLSMTLRKQATPFEKKLWKEFLHSYPVRFQRQKTIDNYIADFYCHQAKLVIELDGRQHYEEENRQYDDVRTRVFAFYGIKVLRFMNSDISKNFSGVCQMIDKTVRERMEGK